ncbi:nuclear transport factor 2 family protein [Thalassorhabdomicrobium marinisediminis]|uniref:nuclear transport factor 2 family protein n=1 Tax=Thalassorhabdomicrobium marinisediminis TaxID=2170577 RepID=UPI00248FCBF3|nr:nuclear transport factor 2 family protein [Thalassorhabdomicrobium marinisediminis]
MTDPTRIASLERRLQILEDKIEIGQILARFGPAVDSLSGDAAAALWTKDGVYDFGSATLEGQSQLKGLVQLTTHTEYVDKGCAHVLGPPVIEIDRDRASATGYSQVFIHDDGQWRNVRTSANHWTLKRTAKGWKVVTRQNRLLDGTQNARDLLARASQDNVQGDNA